MKIAICDDDVKVINEISKTLKRVTREKEMVIPTVIRFASSQELLNYYKNYRDINLIITDIDEKINEEILKELKQMDRGIPIVLVSKHCEAAMKGYRIQAIQFFLKPINFIYFKEIMTDVLEAIKEDKFFINKTKARVDKIYFLDIEYIETLDRHTLIHTKKGDFECYMTMKSLLGMLEDYGFKQPHSSYIVNMNCITRINNSDVELEKGKRIPLSKKRKSEFVQAVEYYYSEY
mgnify:CR=1 FL=1